MWDKEKDEQHQARAARRYGKAKDKNLRKKSADQKFVEQERQEKHGNPLRYIVPIVCCLALGVAVGVAIALLVAPGE